MTKPLKGVLPGSGPGWKPPHRSVGGELPQDGSAHDHLLSHLGLRQSPEADSRARYSWSHLARPSDSDSLRLARLDTVLAPELAQPSRHTCSRSVVAFCSGLDQDWLVASTEPPTKQMLHRCFCALSPDQSRSSLQCLTPLQSRSFVGCVHRFIRVNLTKAKKLFIIWSDINKKCNM